MGPNLLVLGAAKSGSTSLADWLRGHPDIFRSEQKELRYFSHGEISGKGVNAYLEHFRGGADARWRFEASPAYLACDEFPDCAKKIRAFDPEMRLIVMARHPVARCFSHFAHRQREGIKFPRTLVEALADQKARHELIDRGRYRHQIAAYLAHFPPERILTLFLEEARDVGALAEKVGAFLDVNPSAFPDAVERLNVADPDAEETVAELRAQNEALFRAGPDAFDALEADARAFLQGEGKPADYWDFVCASE